MNLRDIKKDIEYVLGAFIDDCSVFATINPNADDEQLSSLLDEAVEAYNELKDKVNAKKIEGSKRSYYASLREEVLAKTDGLYDKLSAVVKNSLKPAEEKPAAKKPAAKKAAPKAEEAPAVEKPAAKKPAAKKAAPKAKEAPAGEKPAAKKPAAKKAPAKKAEAAE